jgi:hypothetical protein
MDEKNLPQHESQADSILQELTGVFLMQRMGKSPGQEVFQNLQTVIPSYISAYNEKHNTQYTVGDIWTILKAECTPGLKIENVTKMNLDFLGGKIEK